MKSFIVLTAVAVLTIGNAIAAHARRRRFHADHVGRFRAARRFDG